MHSKEVCHMQVQIPMPVVEITTIGQISVQMGFVTHSFILVFHCMAYC